MRLRSETALWAVALLIAPIGIVGWLQGIFDVRYLPDLMAHPWDDVAGLMAVAYVSMWGIERTRREESRKTTDATVDALLASLHARDGYTGSHSDEVVQLCEVVARELGFGPFELAVTRQAAALHDLGKVGIPDAVLSKPGPLDDDEWAIMRQHPAIGETIVTSIDELAHLGLVIRAEHERWDGSGYPDGLKGDDIPLISRIVFACDAWHAMTSDRPYRKAMDEADALAELRRNSGSQFDPGVVTALAKVLPHWRSSQTIRLADGSTVADRRSVLQLGRP
jgi:HD-GYP domain-containing protein (c-di-GMP phosphodiesterase class II)